MRFPSAAVACLLLALIESSMAQDKDEDEDEEPAWKNPPPFGASGKTVSWPVGSSQTLKWSAEYDVLSILLWPVPLQGSEYERILDGASGLKEYTWTVSTRFALSNSFFFGLYNDTPTTNSGQGASFKSQNFNIVSARSSRTTRTRTSSTTTLTSTSSTTTRTTTSSTPTLSGVAISAVATTPSSTSTESSTNTPTLVSVANPTSTGLARSTVVGLGVGIGIGIPLILLVGFLVGFRLRKSKRTEPRTEPNGYGIDYSDQVEVSKLPGVDYGGGGRYS